MLGEFARRLLIALPLILTLAVLAILLLRRSRLAGGGSAARRSSGIPGIPGLFAALGGRLAAPAASAPMLDLLQVRNITPAARLAVVRFDGRDLLIGVSDQSFTLLASGHAAAIPAAPGERP